jgi:uncharacterized protein YciW
MADEVILRQMEGRVKSGVWKVDLHNANAVNAAIEVAHAFEEALATYQYRLFPIRSMVIATIQRWQNRFSVRKVFGQQVHVLLVEGGHGEMLSPDNEEFATAVRSCVAHVARLARRYRARLAGTAVAQRPGRARARRRAPAERDLV